MLRCWFSIHKPRRLRLQTQTASSSTVPLGSRCARATQPGGWAWALLKMRVKTPLDPKERSGLSADSPQRQADASGAPQRQTGAGPTECLYSGCSHRQSVEALVAVAAAAATLSGRLRTLEAKGKRPVGRADTTGAATSGSSSTKWRKDSAQSQLLLL